SQTVWVPRRSRLAARMIDLFGCSEDIEEKSLDLQRTLTLIISGQEPTAGLVEMPQGRLLIRGCITDLRDTAARFSRRLRALEAQMPYKDDWVHPAFPDTMDMMVFNGQFVTPMDVFLMACPSFEEDIERSTGFIVFPTQALERKTAEFIWGQIENELQQEYWSSPVWTPELIATYTEKLTAKYIGAMAMSKAHIHDPIQVAALLRNVGSDIARLACARRRLADFIMTELSLESVLR